MCNKAGSVDRSGICLCWDFLCWLVWGYRVSCLAAIVFNDQSHGIDIYSDERRVCTSGLGLAGGPMTPGDNVYSATLGEDKDTDRHDELTGLTGCGVYSSTNRQRPIGNWGQTGYGVGHDTVRTAVRLPVSRTLGARRPKGRGVGGGTGRQRYEVSQCRTFK